MTPCWQCSQPVPVLAIFCPACEGIQPPGRGRSHFEVLGVQERYAIDKEDVERRFKALSRQLHPDRFAMEGPTARRLSMEHATALNDAYRTLKDDAKRARYLLERWGRPITEQSGRKVDMPFDFLEEVMEVRERMAEGDETARQREIDGVRARLAGLEGRAAELFFAHDQAPAEARPGLEAAIERTVHQQRYLQSILNEHAA